MSQNNYIRFMSGPRSLRPTENHKGANKQQIIQSVSCTLHYISYVITFSA